MMSLNRKISIIHAIKCAKTLSEEMAIASFKKCQDYHESIMIGKDIQDEIDSWMNTVPVVSEQEILDIANKYQKQ